MKIPSIDSMVKRIKLPDPDTKGMRKRSRIDKLKYWYHFEMSYILPYRIRNAWIDVKCFFFPRNRWVTRVVPRRWCDKTELIPEILFAAIIDFVEGEKALETIFWKKDQEDKIREIYRWAKEGRQAMKEKISNAYPDISVDDLMNKNGPQTKKSFEELYGKVSRLEAKFEAIETRYLIWIVRNRVLFWT